MAILPYPAPPPLLAALRKISGPCIPCIHGTPRTKACETTVAGCAEYTGIKGFILGHKHGICVQSRAQQMGWRPPGIASPERAGNQQRPHGDTADNSRFDAAEQARHGPLGFPPV